MLHPAEFIIFFFCLHLCLRRLNLAACFASLVELKSCLRVSSQLCYLFIHASQGVKAWRFCLNVF